MAIGMTYDEYWYGDPLMVRAFYKADKLRRERRDEEAWTQGIYFMSALNASVGNMFRKEGQQAIEYPEKPFSMSDKREKQPKLTEEEEATLAYAWMTSFVQNGKNWG